MMVVASELMPYFISLRYEGKIWDKKRDVFTGPYRNRERKRKKGREGEIERERKKNKWKLIKERRGRTEARERLASIAFAGSPAMARI